MITDNFELIKDFIRCEKGEFHLLQIIHRSKDGLTKFDEGKDNFSNKTIKSYYISSPEYLDRKKDEIVEMCRTFNARAYFNPNKKSFRQIALKSLSALADMVSREDYSGILSIVDSTCGQTGSVGEKYWIMDVDTKDMSEIDRISDILSLCEPSGTEKVRMVVPTPHGYHIVARPFNKKRFHELYRERIDIHDNNHTVLFCDTPYEE